MKLLLFLVVLTLVSSGFTQEKPVATKVDEFGKITCEELLARIDNLHTQWQNDPNSHAIVVLDSPRNGPDRSPFYRLLIQKTFQRRGYDFERFQFYRRRTAELGGSMWLLPSGADIPFPEAEPWPDASLDFSRPFLWDTFEEDGVCPTFAPMEYAKILKTNPRLRGRIVVHAATRSAALTSGTDWIKEMTERWGVPRKQLMLIIGKRNKLWHSTDFWIIPIKRK